jgi:DNA replication protein DnaC
VSFEEDTYKMLLGFRIRAFADECARIAADPKCDHMTFLEKVAQAAEAEHHARNDRRVAKYNKEARFQDPMACMEDITYLPNRSLSRDSMARLGECRYIDDGHNVLVISQTGAGKSFVVQALGNAACRRGHKVRYIRHADLCREMHIARRTDEHYEALAAFEDVDLLVIDDLFLEESDMVSTTDLFEIIAHRDGAKRPLILASQLQPQEWHLRIDTKIIADALLDRVVHNSHRIDIEGPNMREYLASQSKLS